MVNQVNLVGRFVATPEDNPTQAGTPRTQFTLAVDRDFVPEGQEKTADFIECVAFGKLAENICKFKKKGDLVHVTGSLRIDSYDDSQGIRRKSARIMLQRCTFLPRGGNGGGGGIEPAPLPEDDEWGSGGWDDAQEDDDIPF